MPGASFVTPEDLRVSLLGLPIDEVDMEGALERIEGFLTSGTPHLVVTLNSEMVVIAQRDAELRRIIERADMVVPDSAGVLWGCRFAGIRLPGRVAGADLVYSLMEKGARNGWKVYLLGGAPGVADSAAERLSRNFKGIKVAGTHHGFFHPRQEQGIIDDIKASAPHILLVGMGVPKQEKWIGRHLYLLGDLEVPLSIGVGGTIDVLAGNVRRAPLWMRNLGFEWFYRILRQPRRFTRIFTLLRFVFLVLMGGRRKVYGREGREGA